MPRSNNRPLLLSTAVVAIVAFAGDARADEAADTANARALGVEGVRLADTGHCAEAVEKLERAEKLHHAPTTATRLGECEIELGRLVSGTERLQRVTRETIPPTAHPAFAQAVARAQVVLDKTLPRLSILRLSVGTHANTKLTILIDNEPVSEATLDTDRRIDPGLHTVEVRAEGYYPTTRTTSLTEGETQSLRLDLRPDPRPKPKHVEPGTEVSSPSRDHGTSARSKVPAIVAFGVGAAAIGGAIYAGTVVDDKAGNLESRCSADRVCPPELQRDISDAKRWATLSTTGFIVGGAAIVTGVALLVWSASGGAPPSTRAKAGVRPSIGLTSVGLDGTF
jgi:hypothetical protein